MSDSVHVSGANEVLTTMEYEYDDPTADEPFQNRDDLNEYDPEAPVVF